MKVGKFLLFLLPPVAVYTSDLEVVEDFFPTAEIDFFLKPTSALDWEGKRLHLTDYKIIPLKGHLYRLELSFRGREKRQKQKLFGVIKVEIVSEPVERNITVDFWYRGGRFIFFRTAEGTVNFDTRPKCVFKKVSDSFRVFYPEKAVKLPLKDGNVNLVLEFTKCNF